MKEKMKKFGAWLLAAALAFAGAGAAKAETVMTESDLTAAITAGGTVTLGADISLSQEVEVGTTVTLDLSTYRVTAAAGANAFQVVSNGNFTINADATNPGGITADDDRCCVYTSYGWHPGPKTVVINGGDFNGNFVFNWSPDIDARAAAEYGLTQGGGGSGSKADPTSVVINGGTFDGGANDGNVAEYRCYYFTVNGGTFEKGLDCADTETCSIGVTSTCKAFFKGGKYRIRYPYWRETSSGRESPAKVVIGDGYTDYVHVIDGDYYAIAPDASGCVQESRYACSVAVYSPIVHFVRQVWQHWTFETKTWYVKQSPDSSNLANGVSTSAPLRLMKTAVPNKLASASPLLAAQPSPQLLSESPAQSAPTVYVNTENGLHKVILKTYEEVSTALGMGVQNSAGTKDNRFLDDQEEWYVLKQSDFDAAYSFEFDIGIDVYAIVPLVDEWTFMPLNDEARVKLRQMLSLSDDSTDDQIAIAVMEALQAATSGSAPSPYANDPYLKWKTDFVMSFDKPVKAGTVRFLHARSLGGLASKIFDNPALEAEAYATVFDYGSLQPKWGAVVGNQQYNNQLIGLRNLSEDNYGTTVTVALRHISPDGDHAKDVIRASYSYTFEDPSPSSPVAMIDETPYETLEAAVAVATKGQTVRLIADVTKTPVYLTDESILKDGVTLDLNGFSILGSSVMVPEGGIAAIIGGTLGKTLTFFGEGTLEISDVIAKGAINRMGGSVSLKTGSYANDPTLLLAPGYVATKNDDGTWTVQEKAVCQIGDVTYPTLAAAVAAVPTDGTKTTIKMLANEEFAGAEGKIAIDSAKNVVLDLNGCTLSYTSEGYGAFISNNGTLEITDMSVEKLGKITAEFASPNWVDGCYTVDNGNDTSGKASAKLIITAGTIENTSGEGLAWPVNNGSWNSNAETTINGGTVHSVNYVPVRQYLQYGGSKKLVINGGTFISDNSRAIAVQFNDASVQESEASVIINGGDFSCNGSGILYMDLHAANLNTTGLHYEVNGGKFKNANKDAPVVVYDDESNVQDSAVLVTKFITAGIYSAKPADETIADGYAVVENTDPDTSETYPWTIGEVATEVAAVISADGTTTNKFASLGAAVAAAVAGDTVRMLCDATENASIDIEKNLAIDLAGTTLTFAQYGNRIGDDALVTFKNGDIAFAKGGAVPTYGAAFHLRGELTLDTVEIKIENCADYVFDALFHIQASNEGEKDTRLVTLNLNNSKIDLSATAASKSIIDAFQGYTQGRDGAVVHVNLTNTKVKMSYCGYFAQYVAQMNLDNSTVEIDNAQEIVSNNNGLFTLVNASSIAIDTCVSHALTGVKLAVNAGSKIDVKNAAYLGINVGDGSVFKAGSIIRAADCCMTDDVGMTGYHNKDIAIRANGKLTIEAGADVICDGVATTVDGASLDIAGGCFKEVTAGGTGTISLTGGVYKNEPDASYVAEGYEVAANVEPFTKDDYQWAIAKKAFVPADPETPITVDITPVGKETEKVPVKVSEVAVAKMVEKGIIEKPKEGEKLTAAEVSAGLAKSQENKQTVWQNYVMGIDGTTEQNMLATIGEKQADKPEEVVVVKTPITEFNPPQNTGVTVTYNLLKKGPKDTKFTVYQEGLPKPEVDVNTIELELGDTLWKFEAVFSAEKPK